MDKSYLPNKVWGYTPVIPALVRMKQEDQGFSFSNLAVPGQHGID